MAAKTALTQNEIRYYLSLLTEEITSYDCGSLCAAKNGSEPFCCSTENTVPLLYAAEFSLLSKRSKMWSRWKPLDKADKKLKKETENSELVFCECRGVKNCERDNRSVSCRTFPLEPYIDKRGVFSGLVFMKEFRTGCPLFSRQKDIRQEFVDQHFGFWEKLLLRKKEEFDTYKDSSRSLRRETKKTGKKFRILLPSFISASDVKDYIY